MINPGFFPRSDRTAFEIAMHNSKLDIAKLLLDKGASIER